MSNARITVPLALDTEVKFAIGGTALPVRAIIGVVIGAVPATFVFLVAGHLGVTRLYISGLFLVAGLVLSLPKTDNIWVGTQMLYRYGEKWFPTAMTQGKSESMQRRWHGDMLTRKASGRLRSSGLPYIKNVRNHPVLGDIDYGLFETKPGGWKAILKFRGPDAALGSESYAIWESQFMQWALAMDIPFQVFSIIDHHDPKDALDAFNRRLRPDLNASTLLDQERELVAVSAANSFRLQSYLILDTGFADASGMPYGSSITTMGTIPYISFEKAQEKLNIAMRTANGFAMQATPVEAAEIKELLAITPWGARHTMATERAVEIESNRSTYHIPYTMIQTPRTLGSGEVVDLLLNSHCRAFVNLSINPVSLRHARKRVDRLIKMRRAASAESGQPTIEDQMVTAEGQDLIEMFASGVKPVNVGLSISIFEDSITAAEESADRFEAQASGKDFDLIHARQPGLWPILACVPAGAPLRRGMVLTVAPVAAKLIPALGTCFNDPDYAYVGMNVFTNSPVYWEIWRPQSHNYNLLMLGTAGGGKSVTFKSLLYRHWLGGSNFVVLDPDNEYRKLVRATGGRYHELGEGGDALNAFSVIKSYEPMEAASLVLPVLSVLGGDTIFNDSGQAIRRMKSEDQSWLHDMLTDFFVQTMSSGSTRIVNEPTLSEFVTFLDSRIASRSVTEADVQRGQAIRQRLSFYTKGKLKEVFDRRSTFTLGDKPVAIGFRSLANSYASDLTPALVMVLTAIFTVMNQGDQKFIIAVDEASYLTGNPDAGQVLDQIARRGRKVGCGIWMASQKLDDFIGTPLGRTLVEVSSTRWILGCQSKVVPQVQEMFSLTDEEVAAINPIRQGQGVLVTDTGERAALQVLVSDALMYIVGTTPNSAR